ncbi:MAG TPA: hydrogenase [Thermoanaerobaculia bacterium]|nr:hydrogenase [Thermoanaerobaculia bacterium]
MQAADSILIVLLLTNFFILGTANLRASIRVVALQGVLLSLLPLFVESQATVRLLLLVSFTAAIKGALIPALLLKAIRDVHIRHEVEPYLGVIPSLFLCAIGTGMALLFGDRLPLAPEHRNALFVPAAMATILAGFLVLTTRRKAISQVTGYLMLENGIYVFGLLLYQAMAVEVGVLLDLVVGIFVMGIVLNHIQREFSSLDTERLSRLRE